MRKVIGTVPVEAELGGRAELLDVAGTLYGRTS
jgi:hypothetical protein